MMSLKDSSPLPTMMMSRFIAAAYVAERPIVVAEAPMIMPVTRCTKSGAAAVTGGDLRRRLVA